MGRGSEVAGRSQTLHAVVGAVQVGHEERAEKATGQFLGLGAAPLQQRPVVFGQRQLNPVVQPSETAVTRQRIVPEPQLSQPLEAVEDAARDGLQVVVVEVYGFQRRLQAPEGSVGELPKSVLGQVELHEVTQPLEDALGDVGDEVLRQVQILQGAEALQSEEV